MIEGSCMGTCFGSSSAAPEDSVSCDTIDATAHCLQLRRLLVSGSSRSSFVMYI